MSERLEQWKAREKIRSDTGWAAVFMGLGGILAVAAGLVSIFGSGDVTVFGLRLEYGGAIAAAGGIILVSCGVGLWNARAWARWVAAALFAALSLMNVIEVVRAPKELAHLLGLVFELFVVVYLLLPSTGRRFARAQGLHASGMGPSGGGSSR